MPDLLEASDLADRIAKAREDEARRIARMIHDHVGQLATAACLAVLEIGDVSRERRPALERLTRCVTALEEGLRGIARELHGSSLADRGLTAALASLIEGFRARLGIPFEVAIAGCDALDRRVATAAYRVVQEALTNVARHARATRVHVEVGGDEEGVRIVVRDDGIGLGGRGAGLGLAAIRERLGPLGGSLELCSPPAGGTELRADLPTGRAPSPATC